MGRGLAPGEYNYPPHKRKKGITKSGWGANGFYLCNEMVGFPRLPNLYKSFQPIESCCCNCSSSNTLMRNMIKRKENNWGDW